MRLALDAMGGDHAPAATVEGALSFARAHAEHQVILVGDERRLRPSLPAGKPLPPNVALRHASEVVAMDEHASQAIRQKPDSSMRVCFELCRVGTADAIVSAGNSGAVMAGALLVLGRLPGVERPAFGALLPTLKGEGHCLLIDAGANVEVRASQLAQFAVMGDAYVRCVLGVAAPRVGVLSNGEEEAKGTELTREALALLKASPLGIVGYVEGKDIFSGEVDLVATDGFTGNIVLKTSEGTAMAVAGLIRSAIDKSGLSEKLGALLMKPTFAGLKKVVDYAEYGGAPLLGVDGTVVVAHGRSNAKAIHNALKVAAQQARSPMLAELKAAMARAQTWLPAKRSKARKGP